MAETTNDSIWDSDFFLHPLKFGDVSDVPLEVRYPLRAARSADVRDAPEGTPGP